MPAYEYHMRIIDSARKNPKHFLSIRGDAYLCMQDAITILRAENETLRAQLATARSGALEEAAKVADEAGDAFDNASPEGNARNGHAHRVAAAIRALKEKQP